MGLAVEGRGRLIINLWVILVDRKRKSHGFFESFTLRFVFLCVCVCMVCICSPLCVCMGFPLLCRVNCTLVVSMNSIILLAVFSKSMSGSSRHLPREYIAHRFCERMRSPVLLTNRVVCLQLITRNTCFAWFWCRGLSIVWQSRQEGWFGGGGRLLLPRLGNRWRASG